MKVSSPVCTLLASAVLAVATLASGAASAQPGVYGGRWYVSGSLGGYFRQDDSVADSFVQASAPTNIVQGSEHIRFDDSALIGTVAAGYRLLPHLRVEAELGYDRVHPDSIHLHTTAAGFSALTAERFERQAGDDYTRFTGEANAFYDLPTLFRRFTPYAGTGVGGSDNHQSEGFFLNAAGVPFTTRGGSSVEGFAMAEGGIAIALTPRLSLVPAYRYVHYFQGGEDVANVAKLGVRFTF